MRIGDTQPQHADVRIIAATNLDLLKEVHREHFRADLYYRLSVFKLRLPALKERISDVPEMAAFFLHFYSLKTNKKISGMDEAFLSRVKSYEWPGNTRELKNVIERAVILADQPLLTADLLPHEMSQSEHPDSESPFKGSIEQLEKSHIRKILELTKGNMTKTAEILGIGIPTLYRKRKKYGI
jgi:two-component system, NtrC family, response regulator